MPREHLPRGLRGAVRELRPRAHDRLRLRRGLDPAHRRRPVHPHRLRSSSCCWATSGVPAAGSWRCAVTPPSRARPTSRRSTTSCPATSRCRTRMRTRDMREYVELNAPRTGFWGNIGAYMTSLLKAWWGDAATADNEYCFDYLPRITGDHSYLPDVHGHARRQVQGLLRDGREPGGRRRPTASCSGWRWRTLDWLVVRDLVEIETRRVLVRLARDRVRRAAHRGHRHRGVLPARRRPHREGRHVHQHPAAAAVAPQGGRARGRLPLASCGSCTTSAASSARSSPGSARTRDRPVLDLTWDYPTEGADDEPDAEAVLREINGCRSPTASRCRRYVELQGRRLDRVRLLDLLRRATPTGSTRPRAASRAASRRWVAPEWGWAWPLNRRMLYNRASADPDGQPVVGAQALRVVGRRGGPAGPATTCPTSSPTSAPDYEPPEDAHGRGRAARRRPLHHAGRRQGLAVRPRRPGGRPAAHPLRARTSRRSTTRCIPAQQANPARAALPAAREPVQPVRTASPGLTSSPTW